jgi:hypothetical protein
MTYLMIQPFPSVKLGLLELGSTGSVDWNGDSYTEVTVSDRAPLFYDWFRDDRDCVVGIDLLIWREGAGSLCDLCSALLGREEGIAQILFLPDVHGTCDGTQAFGDIFFFRSSAGCWLIAVGTDVWLRAGDMPRLRQLIDLQRRP